MNLKEMRTGVVGAGTVGAATARSFMEHVKEVLVYDKDPRRSTHPLFQVLGCDVIFLCLPTPQKENSLECDTSAIDGFFADNPGVHHMNLVIRSTVPVGYTRAAAERFGLKNLVHSPEFLTARCADQDAAMPNRLVIGSVRQPPDVEVIEHPDGGYTQVNRPTMIGHRVLHRLYSERWPGVPILTMTSDESEALKLFTNSFFAVKVATFNEFRDFADKKGLDWEAIVGAMRMDRHINPAHTQVPGHDGFGFAGACLPKDLASLVEQIHDERMPGPYVTLAALERNKYDRQRGGR